MTKRIKIIESLPDRGQEGISHLIGKTFKVLEYDKDDETVSISSEAFDGTNGQIILNHKEYQWVKKSNYENKTLE